MRLTYARLLYAAVTLLLSNYIAAGVLAVRMPAAFRQQFMIAAHAVLAGLLLRAWRAVHMAGCVGPHVGGFVRPVDLSFEACPVGGTAWLFSHLASMCSD